MANIQTSDKKIMSVKLEPEETLIIKFHPDGYNASIHSSNLVEFSIGTMTTPSGRMGLILRLPANNTYRNGASFIVLDDPNGMDKLEFSGIKLERIKDAS